MIQQQLFKPIPPIGKTKVAEDWKFWKHPIQICYSVLNKQPIPLQNVHFYLNVQTGIVIVEVVQEYSTQGFENVIDLEYLFVINKNATVTKMIVEIGDEKKYGIIKEKEEAQNEYEEGIKQGKTMAYSDQDEQMPEIKKVKIGSLAPKTNLKITFEYIQPLEVYLNKFWKVEISPLVDPSYLQENKQSKHTLINYELNEILRKYVLIQEYEFNYKQSISMEIDTGSIITAFKSPTHEIISTGVKDFAKQNEIRKLTLMLQDTPENYQPNKQFILLFSTDDINLPRAILTHTNNDAFQNQKYCATLTMIPKFNEVTLDDAYQQYLDGMNIAFDQKVKQGDYLFFLDRSGSMQGLRIKKAKEALILFLKSLPENCYFNIVSFGTNFKPLWVSSKLYNQQSLDEALKYVSQLQADMGGTEIYKPLQQFVYKELMNKYMKCKKLPLIQNVFLLTDGIVEAKPIIDLIAQYQRPEIRIYSLGIGQGCSQYLIRRVAEVGYGKYHIMNDEEDINAKVIDLLEDSLTSYLKDFALETNVQNIQQIIPAPDSIVCLKKNQELMIQILFSNEQLSNKIEFTLSCYDPQDSKLLRYTISLDLEKSQRNEYFHKIAAHKFITLVEESIREKVKIIDQIHYKENVIKESDLINISLQYQVLSSYTAFICEVGNLEDQFKQQTREKVIVNRCIQKAPEKCKQNQIQIQKGIPPPPALMFSSTKVMEPPGQACFPPTFESMAFQQSTMKKSNQPPPQKTRSSNLISQKKEKVELLAKKQISSIQQAQQKLRRFSVEEECDEQEFENELFIEKQEIIEQNQTQQKGQKKQIISYQQLVLCAQADGSFVLNSNLQKEMRIQEISNIINLKFLVLCTLLSLFYFELCCKENQQSWQIIFSKGVQFLSKNGVNYREEKNILIEKYKQILEN